jgi:hypothetical protein
MAEISDTDSVKLCSGMNHVSDFGLELARTWEEKGIIVNTILETWLAQI